MHAASCPHGARRWRAGRSSERTGSGRVRDQRWCQLVIAAVVAAKEYSSSMGLAAPDRCSDMRSKKVGHGRNVQDPAGRNRYDGTDEIAPTGGVS